MIEVDGTELTRDNIVRQLTQNLKNGEMEFLDIPMPSAHGGQLVVKTIASIISVGTEGRSVKDARAGYIEKARSRPKEVKQVIETAKKFGVVQTYQMVMDKLNAPSPLGYSLAGEVLEVGNAVKGFKVGDRVACGGQGAVHADVVSVLPNLSVRVPDRVDMESAAFTTVGAVAIQGVRQARINFGERCAIIGLGLLGQLSIQILKAAGVETVGIDIDGKKVQLAEESGVDLAFTRDEEGLEEQVMAYTDGHGVDAVVITAATQSNDPINLAGRLARRKGTVVSVGRVSTDFNRDPYYYKELDLRMSCSYGPGRYDSTYEEKGVDYPFEYVRWTENRNMQAFVNLLSRGLIDLEPLVTHRFPFKDAPAAYDMVSGGDEPFVGVVLQYPSELDTANKPRPAAEVRRGTGALNVGFIGAGSFAQKFLLPNVTEAAEADMVAVATTSGHSAEHARRKYGFHTAHNDGFKVAQNPEIDTVFIATRHDSHADYVLACLEANKHVFVEKPLCLTRDELETISETYGNVSAHLMVGYNRRFAPQISQILDILGRDTPKAINYRINTGPIDPGHWTRDPDIGGGRIVGEVCHFIDLALHLTGAEPVSVYATNLEQSVYSEDTVSTVIKFANGSIASIDYYTNGDERVDKERLEVHANGSTAVLEDYRGLRIYGNKKHKSKTKTDKGHENEVKAFLAAVGNGAPTPIPFDELYWTSLLTFDVLESIATRRVIEYR